MGNCKDCKWWDSPPEETEYAKCEVIGVYEMSRQNTHDHDKVTIAVSGYEWEYAELWTKGDFGCTLFEAKEC